MGRLTTNEKIAILAKGRALQTVAVYAPRGAGSTYFDPRYFAFPSGHTGGEMRVLRWGKRKFRAIGVNAMDTRKLLAARWEFEVSNHDGLIHPFSADSYWTSTYTGYQAYPNECYVEHEIAIWNGVSYDTIGCVSYRGSVQNVHFIAGGVIDGVATPARAVITTEDTAAYSVLKREWTKEDGRDTLVTDTADGDAEVVF